MSFNVMAQQKEYFSNQEKIQQQRDLNRQENARIDEANKPNEPYKPTNVNINIDSSAQFDIKNSFLGYSKIFEGDKEVSGIKVTGAMNVGFYKVTNSKKSIRLMGGIELPAMDINERSDIFMGGGLQFGDNSAFYLSSGYNFLITNWLKTQAGVHYGLGKDLGLMLNLGLSW
jgi:hypothetical protein